MLLKWQSSDVNGQFERVLVVHTEVYDPGAGCKGVGGATWPFGLASSFRLTLTLDHHAMNFKAAMRSSTPSVSAVHTSQVLSPACRSILASFSALVHSLAVMMKVFTACTSKGH